MAARARVVLGGLVAYAGGVGGAYYFGLFQPKDTSKQKGSEGEALLAKAVSEEQRNEAFQRIANEYDSKIALDEVFMGVFWQRRKLIKKCSGDTLEIGIGTGRNLKYYDAQKLTSFIGTDQSSAMIEVSRAKAGKLGEGDPGLKALFSQDGGFRQMDAQKLEFSDGSFDSVVDTFGLCSYESPEAVLGELKRVCRKGGSILLLEHGKSSHRRAFNWLNDFLDASASRHAEEWGCWWNRDIDAIVQEAGLKIVEKKYYNFGTHYLIVATHE